MQSQKRRFTDQEFDIMIDQLTVQKPASFEMLCEIAEKTLHRWVAAECGKCDALRGKNLEDDIFHDVQIKLIQKTVTDFLLRNGPDGGINRDPDGFKSWMFTVAGNLILDTARKASRSDCRCRGFLDGEESTIEDGNNVIENGTLLLSEERMKMLKLAMSIVLDSRSQPYIVLTWLAMCVFMLDQGVTKIVSNHKILDVFFEKSLSEMFDMLCAASKRIPWLVITDAQKKKMSERLRKKADGERTYGEMPYKAFFLKKEPLSAISDWENRMNSLAKRVMIDETSNIQ